jgi:DNA-binding NarL/FixJ family response regulator
MKQATVIIADDHKLFRQGLKSLFELTSEIEVVGEAENGLEAVELCEKLNPDIIIMDIGMPEMNGLLASKEIARRNLKTAVIILSTHLRESYIGEALKIGVRGYVVKDSAVEDLVSAIEAVMKGETYLSPKATSLPVRKMLERDGVVLTPLDILSPREQEVLQLLVEGKTNKEIAEALFISPKTVDNHRTSIMKKLEVHDIASLVKYAIRADFTEP